MSRLRIELDGRAHWLGYNTIEALLLEKIGHEQMGSWDRAGSRRRKVRKLGSRRDGREKEEEGEAGGREVFLYHRWSIVEG
jgi:hypothetical protein